jgi:hypothetical protein
MRTTVTLDDALLARAEQLCGDLERSALLKEALRALVQRESARRLAALGGSEPAPVPSPCWSRIWCSDTTGSPSSGAPSLMGVPTGSCR